jgi:HSP20 family protein
MPDSCAANPQNCESERRQCECHYQPNVDIYEQADEIVILADLPGAASDTIELDFEEGELSIKARVESRQDPETSFLVREYGTGDYRRKFRVSEVVDGEQISASYNDGVLAVHLPKVQAAKPRRVVINPN